MKQGGSDSERRVGVRKEDDCVSILTASDHKLQARVKADLCSSQKEEERRLSLGGQKTKEKPGYI